MILTKYVMRQMPWDCTSKFQTLAFSAHWCLFVWLHDSADIYLRSFILNLQESYLQSFYGAGHWWWVSFMTPTLHSPGVIKGILFCENWFLDMIIWHVWFIMHKLRYILIEYILIFGNQRSGSIEWWVRFSSLKRQLSHVKAHGIVRIHGCLLLVESLLLVLEKVFWKLRTHNRWWMSPLHHTSLAIWLIMDTGCV